jgi:hypothetical protein
VFFEKPFDPRAVVATFRDLSNRMIIDMTAFPPQPRVAMKRNQIAFTTGVTDSTR